MDGWIISTGLAPSPYSLHVLLCLHRYLNKLDDGIDRMRIIAYVAVCFKATIALWKDVRPFANRAVAMRTMAARSGKCFSHWWGNSANRMCKAGWWTVLINTRGMYVISTFPIAVCRKPCRMLGERIYRKPYNPSTITCLRLPTGL